MENNIVHLININEIYILNPRERNRLIAGEISQNILRVGLKRPITVREREYEEDGKKYDLVCGQGRLEAFIEAGVEYIPAIISSMSAEDACISSLVENIARRNYTSIELIRQIKYLKDNGYSEVEISQKTSLDKNYIHGILKLIENGEERLIRSVESGLTPLYIALKIATESDVEVQQALLDAQEKGKLGAAKLASIQKLLTKRALYGKGRATVSRNKTAVNSDDILVLYENSIRHKRKIIRRSDFITNILYMTIAALKKVCVDNNFQNQLKVEGLGEIPKRVKELIGVVV